MDSGKHIFPGGNTSKGFVNYFASIVPTWEEHKRTYILKGGPGVGKNTFMRLLGKTAEIKGFETEYYHCASDMESLDAIRIPKLGIMMVDGTAPHIIDPVLPGAEDGIINLGVFLEEEKLKKEKEKIKKCFRENSFCYQNTYAYLRAAGELQCNLDKLYLRTLDKRKLIVSAEETIKHYIKKNAEEERNFCPLFASAFTPQGYVDYADTIIREENIIRLKGPLALCVEFLSYVKGYLENKGYGGRLYCDPLLPDHIVHLVVDNISFCITTEENKINTVKDTINLEECVDSAFLVHEKELFEFHYQQIKILKEKAMQSLKESKEIHDELEQIYKEYIDFKGVTEYTKNFIAQVIG